MLETLLCNNLHIGRWRNVSPSLLALHKSIIQHNQPFSDLYQSVSAQLKFYQCQNLVLSVSFRMSSMARIRPGLPFSNLCRPSPRIIDSPADFICGSIIVYYIYM